MAKILLVWEMGGGLGHISRLNVLAKLLVEKQHIVTIVLPENTLADVYSTSNCHYVMAPNTQHEHIQLSRSPVSYTEILLATYYHNTDELTRLIAAWKKIFIQEDADLIIYDAAPTALLASRELKAKKINLGTAFFIPPNQYPLPAFSTAKVVTQRTLKKSDDLLLHNINQALGANQLTSIEKYKSVFTVDLNLITSLPELDPYATYRPRQQKQCEPENSEKSIRKFKYIEQFLTHYDGDKTPLDWSNFSTKKNIYAYLKYDYPQLKNFLSVFITKSIEARIYISGLPQKKSENDYIFDLSFPKDIIISTAPYELNDELDKADLIICHGGSLINLALLKGVPIMAIPLQQEQFTVTQKCIDHGLGLGLNPHEQQTDKISTTLDELLTNSKYKVNAQKLKNTYSCARMNSPTSKALFEIEELLSID